MSKSITFRFWVPEETDTTPIDGRHPHRFSLAALRGWLETLEAAAATGAYVSAEQLTEKEIAEIADGNAQRKYYADVKGFVTDLKAEIADGTITTAEGAREYLEQSIDGCHDVIYTYAAQEVCRISRNDGAYFDDFGTEGAISDGGIEWSKLAYCALLADVMEEVGDLEAWFQCAECNGEVTPEDVKAAGDDLPVCAECRGEGEADEDEEAEEAAEGADRKGDA